MNRLASQTSPYLRQHQDNPVDWYPWGDDAFAAAQAEDKPILLSVGYSSCHWCHVMAHESFEDETVAAEMNRRFVNVKVDREERPDVDALYMEAVQAMTGRGGWPMTVFLAPDGRPFYGGTYYPRETFLQLLTAVDEAWRERRGDLLQQAATLTTAIEQTANLTGADDLPGIELLDTALQALASGFDAQFGGFGRAPKFPNTMNLELCLRAYAASGSDGALTVVTTSLDAMASGGIYDQLGGGFARYSTDPFWIVPHFEKMLYDQALLARIYLHGFQATGETRFAQVCAETIDYVRRDLRHPDGGFLSAEDADSIGPDGEPEEGAFYVWRPEQLLEALGPELGAEAIGWWGVTSVGNFENANVLYRPRRGEIIRPDTIENARAALFAVRQQRPRPGKDDKVLAEWNGLMLATLAEAAAVLGRADWLTDAETSAEFLLAHLRRADGRWVRSWHADGGTPPLAMAADLAALVDAFTRLAEATGKRRWLDEAVEVAEQLLSWHWDAEKGGIATIADDAEALLVRQKDVLDNATPSANSIAAVALIRLAALTGERRYHHLAEQIVLLLAPTAERQPTSFAHLVGAVDLLRSGTTEIVIPGDRPELRAEVTRRYLPNAVLAWGEPTDSPLFDGREEGHAYVCQGGTCQLPATSIEALAAQLDALRPTPDAPAA